MPLRSKSQSAHPADLTSRLVAAREAYDAERTEVIDLAVERQRTVQQTIADLQAESAALSKVQDEARK